MANKEKQQFGLVKIKIDQPKPDEGNDTLMLHIQHNVHRWP